MSRDPIISRRAFCAAAPLLAVRLQPGRAALSASLAALVGDPAAWRAVGRRRLAMHPEETRRATLLAALADGYPAGAPLAARRAWFVARCRDDFAAGRVERVEGWVMARTELRLAALLAL
ncbi:MAG: hypothetical protein U1E53_03705 [Dongiaceae bacterium]